MIHSTGNFIESTDETPFLLLGEHKYGEPILDRVIQPETPIGTALKAAMVSMEATIRSNLTVGMPLDLVVIEKNALAIALQKRIEEDDSNFEHIS